MAGQQWVHARSGECREQLLARFAAALEEVPDDVLEQWHPELLDEATVRRAVMAAVAPVAWASVARGEFFRTNDLVDLLGITRQAIAKRVAAGTLLGIPGKGTTLFPTWQFERESRPIRLYPAMAAAMAAWRDELGTLDAWAFSAWATTEQPELHGVTPESFARKSGPDIAQDLELAARATASRLAQ